MRESAELAIRWARTLGIEVPTSDLVFRLSQIGAGGRREQNSERDLQRAISKFGPLTQVPISSVWARFYDYRTDEVVWRPTSVIMPDDLAVGLWEAGVFEEFLVGGMNLKDFWDHCAKADWYKQHPSFHTSPEQRAKLIPFSMYGDDVQAFRNSEAGAISIMAWSSEVTFRNRAMARYFLLATYSEATSTSYTYSEPFLIATCFCCTHATIG